MMKTTIVLTTLALTMVAFAPGASAGVVKVGVEGCAGNYACGGEQTNHEGDRIEQRAYAQGGDAECGNGALVWQNIVLGDNNNICTGGDGQVCQDAGTDGGGSDFDWRDLFGAEVTYDAAASPSIDVTVTIAGNTSSRTAVEPGCQSS